MVLAAQDTTEFNQTHLPATTGLGYGSVAHIRGFFMHSLLALTPEGLPLGALGLKTWARPMQQYAKGHRRKQLAITDKESAKWLEGLARRAGGRALI